MRFSSLLLDALPGDRYLVGNDSDGPLVICTRVGVPGDLSAPVITGHTHFVAPSRANCELVGLPDPTRKAIRFVRYDCPVRISDHYLKRDRFGAVVLNREIETALLALTTGLGTYQAGPENIIAVALRQGGVVLLVLFLLMSMLRMYGEEFGWRGYLLPELTARWGRVRATAAVGVVWALFHSVFLYRAGVAIGVENPLLITAVQAVAVFTISFPFSYAYYLTDGSVFPVMILHLIWNILNPWILGDIYGNVGGLIVGQIFVVNGEGVVGAVMGLVALGGFVIVFRRGTHITS